MENCKSCQAEINENDFMAITTDGDTLCESCEQNAWEYSNTLVVAFGSEIKTYRWCSEFGYRDTENWEEAKFVAVPHWSYHKTDGWRGYWVPTIGDGFLSVGSGWATGRHSDVAHKHTFNNLCEDIQSGNAIPPVPVYFAFGLTSNVFSTSVDVIVRQSDMLAFAEWMHFEMGISVEDLQGALG